MDRKQNKAPPGNSYKERYQRLPKRDAASLKTIKKLPSTKKEYITDDNEQNINEDISYQNSINMNQTEPVFTAPPEKYTMNIGLPASDQINFNNGEGAGEFVQVVVRIRPMLQFEISRGDDYCIKTLDSQNMQLNKGYILAN